MTLMEGKGFGEVKERLDKVGDLYTSHAVNMSLIATLQAYQPTLLRNWGVFIPTQIINFALVPHHLRFVVVSVVSLFWST